MKHIYLLIFVSICLASCANSSNKEEPSEMYDVSNAVDGTIDEVFSAVELLPLEFNGETYPNAVNELTVTDDYILVYDNKRKLHVFDSKGHALGCSASKSGRGPGEFFAMLNYAFSDSLNQIYIIDLYKLFIYTPEFEFIKSVDLPTKAATKTEAPFYLDAICPVSAKEFLVLPSPAAETKDKLMGLDVATGKLRMGADLSADKRAEATMQSQSFFPIGGGEIMFVPMFYCDYIYSIDFERLSAEKAIKVFDSNGISDDEMDTYRHDEMELSNHIIECTSDVVLRKIPSRTRINVLMKNGDNMRYFYNVMINRLDGTMIKTPLYDKDRQSRIFPILYQIDDDYAWGAVEKEILSENPALLMATPEEVDSMLASIEDESLIVLKYRFRS